MCQIFHFLRCSLADRTLESNTPRNVMRFLRLSAKSSFRISRPSSSLPGRFALESLLEIPDYVVLLPNISHISMPSAAWDLTHDVFESNGDEHLRRGLTLSIRLISVLLC
jgi:hypothetical protein